jgi:hypothetical protein
MQKCSNPTPTNQNRNDQELFHSIHFEKRCEWRVTFCPLKGTNGYKQSFHLKPYPMKTLKFASVLSSLATLLLILFFSSCDSTEYIESLEKNASDDLQSTGQVMINDGKLLYEMDKSTMEWNEKLSIVNSADRNRHDFALYQLFDFRVARTELGTLSLNNALPIEDEEAQTLSYQNRVEKVHLTGYGKGWSDEFGVCFVTTEMEVNTKSMELIGVLECTIESTGDTMRFKLEGSGPIEIIENFDGPHKGLKLKTKLIKGTGKFEKMQMNGISYFLNASEILNPEIESFNSYVMTIGEMVE